MALKNEGHKEEEEDVNEREVSENEVEADHEDYTVGKKRNSNVPLQKLSKNLGYDLRTKRDTLPKTDNPKPTPKKTPTKTLK